MTPEQMRAYFEERYAPDNMYLAVTGNVDPRKVIGTAEELCGDWKPSGSPTRRMPPMVHKGVDKLRVDRFKQQILALTFPSISACDPRIETLSAAVTILGGDNSRFYWEIVQKGIAPRAGAYHMDYTDSGVLLLYGSCEPERAEALLEALRIEADGMCKTRVAQHEIDRVKNKRRTSLAVEAEAPYYRLTQLMDDMEYHGAPRTIEQTLADVDAVTVDSIYEYFQEHPINVEHHLASVGPRDWPTGR